MTWGRRLRHGCSATRLFATAAESFRRCAGSAAAFPHFRCCPLHARTKRSPWPEECFELSGGITREPRVNGLFFPTMLRATKHTALVTFVERSVLLPRVPHQPRNIFHRERVIGLHRP